jgi:hypothetical protein
MCDDISTTTSVDESSDETDERIIQFGGNFTKVFVLLLVLQAFVGVDVGYTKIYLKLFNASRGTGRVRYTTVDTDDSGSTSIQTRIKYYVAMAYMQYSEHKDKYAIAAWVTIGVAIFANSIYFRIQS